MSKLILLLSFACLGLLVIVGSVAPDSPIMWLASTSKEFDVLRLILMAMLISLLVTNPPRHPTLRLIVGIMSVSLMAWCLSGTYDNRIQVVDSFSIMAASVSAGLAALERDFEPEFPIPRKQKHHNA